MSLFLCAGVPSPRGSYLFHSSCSHALHLPLSFCLALLFFLPFIQPLFLLFFITLFIFYYSFPPINLYLLRLLIHPPLPPLLLEDSHGWRRRDAVVSVSPSRRLLSLFFQAIHFDLYLYALFRSKELENYLDDKFIFSISLKHIFSALSVTKNCSVPHFLLISVNQ